MQIGQRLRMLREAKGLSQGDVERRSGLLRSYISRVEGGYTAPSLVTLEKFARALELQTYQLLYTEPNGGPKTPGTESPPPVAKSLRRLLKLYESMSRSHRRLLLELAVKLSRGD